MKAADDKPISVFAMKRDPRLRKLFALVGRGLADFDFNPDVEDAFYDVLLDLCPEFLPPDELGGPDDDSQTVDAWQMTINAAIRQEVSS